MLELLKGLGGSEYAWLIARIATGIFFTISGFFKLFNPGRHRRRAASDGNLTRFCRHRRADAHFCKITLTREPQGGHPGSVWPSPTLWLL